MGIQTLIHKKVKRSILRLTERLTNPLEFFHIRNQIRDQLYEKLKKISKGSYAPDQVEIWVSTKTFNNNKKEISNLIKRLQKSIFGLITSQNYEIINPTVTVSINLNSKLKDKEVVINFNVSKEDDIKTVLVKNSCVIHFLSGEYQGKKWKLESGKKIRIGRNDYCDIRFKEKCVTRDDHAVLEMDERGNIFIRDTGSTNGTFINNEKIPVKEKRKVKMGDNFRLCKEPGIRFRIESQ